MFRQLLSFELRQTLGRTSCILYFLLFFAFAFLLAIAAGGAFEGFTYSFGLSSKLPFNSPVAIHRIITYVGIFSFLIIPPIFGRSIARDFETGFHQVLFATPISKSSYFFVRFVISVVAILTISSSFAIGIWIASLMPFVDQTLVMANHLTSYFAPYLTAILPNILMFGALFMGIAAKTKKMAPIYVTSIVLYASLMIARGLGSDLDNQLLVSLLDPFGTEASFKVIRYWSAKEQMGQSIPLTGHFLYNRLLWGGIGGLLLLIAYHLFDPFSLPKKRPQKKTIQRLFQPTSQPSKLAPHSWKVFLQLSFSEMKQAFANIYFLVILLSALLYLFSTASFVGKIFGTETLPVTYHVLELVGASFGIFMLILTTFYAGELVWKEKTLRISQLIDPKPVRTSFFYLSKLLALIWIQVFFLGVTLLASVLIQIFKGYTHFEWSIYFTQLFFFTLPRYVLICVLTLFAHTLSPNKFLGHGIVLLYYALFIWLPAFGLDHSLYQMGRLPSPFYSDMNGYGPSFYPFTIYTLYWGAFYLALAILTILFWQRGVPIPFKERILEFKERISLPHKALLSTSLSLWIVLGGLIFYNTNILNNYVSKKEEMRRKASYEKTYKHFTQIPHPQLTGAQLHVDLFPEKRGMCARGTLRYQNKGQLEVSQILLCFNKEPKHLELNWNKPTQLNTHDTRLGIYLYDLASPLVSGEEIKLEFSLQIEDSGFRNSGGFPTDLVENGTFFHGSTYFPLLGYQPSFELSGERQRRKYHLPEKPRLASFDDWDALQHHYISNEGSWIDFEVVLSTSEDQIAIAPGHLEQEWRENGRRYFHYKAERPILPMYAFLSARYAVAKDEWNGVNIEILYHPSHTYNIDRMVAGVKKSLDYYTTHFSPYPFQDLRIVEFPRYSTFAQAFPTMIPYSEGIGFIAKVDSNNPKDIDYPFYVTAHEMAHQWWAHQVIGGDVQGATMLSESLAQYSALMVLEKEVGGAQMQKFFQYELDKYLSGRAMEPKVELPLMLNENQQYIHYHKGSLAFYALKDYLGEEKVNEVLREYIADVAYQEPPYTRAVDLVYRFKEAVSPEYRPLIEDLFETITFYENQTESLTYCEIEPGIYQVEITARSKKTRSDENGIEKEIPLNDWIDVGLFDKEGKLIYLEKHRVCSGTTTYQIIVHTEPAKGGLDPLNKLIDKLSSGHTSKAIKKNKEI